MSGSVGRSGCGAVPAVHSGRSLFLAVCTALAAGFTSHPLAAVEVERGVIAKTGMATWKFADHGFSLELVQLHQDYIRAIYESRGFTAELIDDIASYCVFGSIAKNLSDTPLSYRVADWRVVTVDGREQVLKTKSEWVAEWKLAGIPYNWSILPDDQTFEVGDWSQGFTTVKADRDSHFDLKVKWTVKGENHEAIISDLRCPPVEIQPKK